jgi:LPS O-antigen subunit length determinant protein (WzzB/FepE family)
MLSLSLNSKMSKKLNSFEIDIFYFFKSIYRNIKIIFILGLFGGLSVLIYNLFRHDSLQKSFIIIDDPAATFMKYNNSFGVKELYDADLSLYFRDTFFLDLVQKKNIDKFIQILKDKNTFKVFLLDKSLDEKTYIPNIKIKIDKYSDNLINRSLLTDNAASKVVFFIEFPSRFNGHKFLIEYINFVKLNSLEKTRHLSDFKFQLKIELLELENKILNAQLNNQNDIALMTKFNLEMQIDKLKIIKENFKISSFDFNILELEDKNIITKVKYEDSYIKNKSKKLIIDIFLGFLTGIAFSLCYVFFRYIIKNQHKSSKIFK